MISNGATHALSGEFSHHTQGLKGKLILDCSILLPGPFVGKLLALQGARVVKIENPDRPDPAKRMGAFYDDLNSLKEIRQIDITHPLGRREFHELLKGADGLIEGFRPETKLKLGLDESTLHKVQPSLIIGSIIGYPEEGPWRNRAGHDLNFQATTGLLGLSHEMPPLPWADLFASYQMALSMTALLNTEARNRAGQRVKVSMSETLIEIQSLLFAQYKFDQHLPAHGTNLFSGGFPCYRIYSMKCERRIAVGCIEPKFWRKFCEILALDPESKQRVIDGQFARGQEALDVVQCVATALRQKNWDELAPIIDSLDCCIEPILGYHEINLQ